MSLLLGAMALALAASAWVVLPILLRRFATVGDAVAGGVLDAEARKRVALASLKEVEYDRIGGKLDDADYLEVRGRLEREALVAIQAVDAAHGVPVAAPVAGAHACGFVNPPASRFCSGCGAPLA